MPQVDEKGSTSVMGSAGEISSGSESDRFINFVEKNIELNLNSLGGGMIHYTILSNKHPNLHKLEEGFEVEGGLYQKDARIKQKGGFRQERISVSLLGTREVLELAKHNCNLVVLYREEFRTNKLFALLLEETEKENVYHRLGLVEVGNSGKISSVNTRSDYSVKTIIGANGLQMNLETDQEKKLQAQIQVDPKGNN